MTPSERRARRRALTREVLFALLGALMVLLMLAALILAAPYLDGSGDYSAASGMPPSATRTPSPLGSPPTTTTPGPLVVLLATETPEPTTVPRPTATPKPACPDNPSRPVHCYKEPPTPTPLATHEVFTIPTPSSCAAVTDGWCIAYPATPSAPTGRNGGTTDE